MTEQENFDLLAKALHEAIDEALSEWKARGDLEAQEKESDA